MVFGFWVLVVPPAPGARETAPAASRPAGDATTEYRRRLAQLNPRNVQGHYELAEWCRQQKQYGLLYQQAQYVLKLDPNHENARLLLRIAQQNLQGQPADQPPDEAGARNRKQPRAPGEATGEYLTEADIEKLRFAELLDPPPGEPIWPVPERPRPRNVTRWESPQEARKRIPAAAARNVTPERTESVQVAFDDNVRNVFLDAMSGHRDFSNRQDRTRFLELPTTQQVQLMRQYSGDRYASRIHIHNDPLVFKQFKRVLPIVMQGCATSNCHGGSEIKSFRLRTARAGSEANLYTNFLILNRFGNGKEWLIDRSKPPASLLLECGLPSTYAQRMHSTPINPLFARGPDDPKYQTILSWIETLRVPYPRTDLTLPGSQERPAPGAMLGGSGQAPEQDKKKGEDQEKHKNRGPDKDQPKPGN